MGRVVSENLHQNNHDSQTHHPFFPPFSSTIRTSVLLHMNLLNILEMFWPNNLPKEDYELFIKMVELGTKAKPESKSKSKPKPKPITLSKLQTDVLEHLNNISDTTRYLSSKDIAKALSVSNYIAYSSAMKLKQLNMILGYRVKSSSGPPHWEFKAKTS